MKKVAMLLFGLALFVPVQMFGWNCSVAGEVRVQVPPSYTGSGTGDGNNQVVSQGGLNFVCETLPTPPTTPSTTTNTSNSTSGASATSGSTSSATGGNSSSKSGVSNSGNSSNKNTLNNTNTLANTQGQKQGQSQNNASTNSNQSAGGSVSNVGNSQTLVEAPSIPVNTAIAPPVFSTANCFKGYSAAGQTAVAGLSFGGGKIDKNCAAERIAQDYFAMGNRLAACKVIISTKASKDAGVTLEECLNVPVRVTVVAPSATVVAPEPIKVEIVNNIPPPQIITIHEEMTVTAPRTQAKKRVAHRPCSVTPIQNSCPTHPQEK